VGPSPAVLEIQAQQVYHQVKPVAAEVVEDRHQAWAVLVLPVHHLAEEQVERAATTAAATADQVVHLEVLVDLIHPVEEVLEIPQAH
jgi:hypothetical protein